MLTQINRLKVKSGLIILYLDGLNSHGKSVRIRIRGLLVVTWPIGGSLLILSNCAFPRRLDSSQLSPSGG